MGIIEFVGILCEAVDRHSENFQPVLFQSQAYQTGPEIAERAGGILCTVHLTPSGELSEAPTGCACTFCVRPSDTTAKPNVAWKGGGGVEKDATEYASPRVREVVELQDLLARNHLIRHYALRIAVECVYGLKDDYARHVSSVHVLQKAEDMVWDDADDEKLRRGEE